MKSLFIALLTGIALAQTPATPTAAPEKLTATEVLALNQVAQEINKASQDAGNVVADIQKAHPGYTYDFRTGQLQKVVPLQTPAAQPKTENRTKTAPETPVPAKPVAKPVK